MLTVGFVSLPCTGTGGFSGVASRGSSLSCEGTSRGQRGPTQDREASLRGDNDAWRKAGGRKRLGRQLLQEDIQRNQEYQAKQEQHLAAREKRLPRLSSWITQSIESLMQQLNAKTAEASTNGRPVGEPSRQWISTAKQLVESEAFGPKHAVRLIYILAKANTHPTSAVAKVVQSDRFLRKWADALVFRMNELSTQELVLLPVSLTKLGRVPNQAFMSNWYTAARSRLPDLSPRELLLIILAISRTGEPVENHFGQAWLHTLQSKRDQVCEELHASEMAKMLTAMKLVKLAMDEPVSKNFFSMWMEGITSSLSELPSADFVLVLRSLKESLIVPSDDFQIQARQYLISMPLVDQETHQLLEVPETALSLAIYSNELGEKWMREFAGRLDQNELSTVQLLRLTEVMMSCKISISRRPAQSWVKNVTDLIPGMNAFEVASVAKALDSLDMDPPREVIRSLVLNFQRLIPLAAACNLSDFLLAMGGMKIYLSQSFAVTWTRRATTIFESFRAQELADLAVAWGMLRVTPPAILIGKWDERMQICITSGIHFNAADMAAIFRGVVRARIIPSEKLVAFSCALVAGRFKTEAPSDIKEVVDVLEGLAGMERMYRTGSLRPSGRLVQPAHVGSILRALQSVPEVSNPNDLPRGMLMCATLRTRVPARWGRKLVEVRESLTGEGLAYKLAAYGELLPLLPSLEFCGTWNTDVLRCLETDAIEIHDIASIVFSLARLARGGGEEVVVERLEAFKPCLSEMLRVAEDFACDRSQEAPELKLGELLWGVGVLAERELADISGLLVDCTVSRLCERTKLWLKSDAATRLHDPVGEDLGLFKEAWDRFLTAKHGDDEARSRETEELLQSLSTEIAALRKM